VNNGWAFIRDGITICSSKLKDNEIDAASLVSHELAHTWSSGAPLDWEDWLHESFAEYGSLLFLEKRFGVDAYKSKLVNLKEANKKWHDMEPIKPRVGTARPNSVHTKGAIVFDELGNLFGYGATVDVIRTFDQLRPKTTANLISAIRNAGTLEIADYLANKIDEPF
jgi:aminopeptidase N